MVKEARKIFGNDREAMNRFLRVKKEELREERAKNEAPEEKKVGDGSGNSSG